VRDRKETEMRTLRKRNTEMCEKRKVCNIRLAEMIRAYHNKMGRPYRGPKMA
jgi:hypothetical protein